MNFIPLLRLSLLTILIPGWLTYTNSLNKFTVNYPKEWTQKESINSILFLSPKESLTDSFQENVNIMLQDLSANPMTLDQFAALSKKQITDYAGASAILSCTPRSFAGQKAMEAIYTMNFQGHSLKLKQVWLVKGNTAFVLTYTAEEATYARYEETATAVINSFKFF